MSGHSFQIRSVAAMRLKDYIGLFFTILSLLHSFCIIKVRSTGSLGKLHVLQIYSRIAATDRRKEIREYIVLITYVIIIFLLS